MDVRAARLVAFLRAVRLFRTFSKMQIPAATQDKLKRLSEATLLRLAVQAYWAGHPNTELAINELKEHLRIEADLIDSVLMDLCEKWPEVIEGC